VKKLLDYDWPGNVRELENTITNMCINTPGSVIQSSAIPDYGVEPDMAEGEEGCLDRFISSYLEDNEASEGLLSPVIELVERKMIEQIGRKFDGNKFRISEALGISRVTLAKKMNQLGM